MAHHLSPHDVVPPLRGDLEPLPAPSGTGAEVITVAPFEGTGAMRMHGFEFSIARMLDGRRTAQDVLVSCKRLGLPVNLDALEDFLFQLETHGLLGAQPLDDRPGTSWQPAVRDLYRDALKAARQGEFESARAYLNAMDELSPGTVEAARLRSWVEHHPDPLVAGRTFGEVFQRTLDSWAEERPPHWAAEARDTLRRTWWPVLGVLTAIGFLILFAFLPTPHRVSASAQLSPLAEVAVPAAASGVLDQVMVKEGDRVEAGAPLFAYDVGELQVRWSELAEQLDAARAPLRAQVAKTPEGMGLADTVSQAEQELSRAQAALLQEQKDSAGAPPNERTNGAEQRFAAAHDAVEVAKAELDARIPPDAPGAQSVRRLATELQGINEKIRLHTVKAPAPGVVTRLYVQPGSKVNQGDTVLQLEDQSRMRLVATVTPKHARRLEIGTPITVKIGEDRIHTRVDAVSGDEIAAELPNPNGELKAGVVQVQIDLPPSPLARR